VKDGRIKIKVMQLNMKVDIANIDQVPFDKENQ
jgi:hypothetical protein